MNRHLVTLLVLVAALAAYGMGLAGFGSALVFVGMGLEAWFWVRLISAPQRPEKTTSHS